MSQKLSAKAGLYLALATALISGVSVFLNKFASQAITNSNLLATAKNLVVALFLSLLILTPTAFAKLKTLTRRDWLKLFAIGVIGGSVPFLLFFKGLSLSSSVSSAFIHKTLFIWVALLAIPFLKEKFSKLQLVTLGFLLAGTYLLAGFKTWQFSTADLLILAATLLWAVEFIIAKKVLDTIDAKIVTWSRMFFGALILLGYLLITGQGSGLLTFNQTQSFWLIITAGLLIGYVLTWYTALKALPASTVTCVLVIAAPITTLLNNIFVVHRYAPNQIYASLLMIAAIALIIWQSLKHKKIAANAI